MLNLTCKVHSKINSALYSLPNIISLVLVTLVFCVNSTADTRVWTNSGGNNLWNNPNNWSPTGVPTSTDTAKFSSAGSANCSMNVSPNIQALLIENTYSGVLSAGNNTLTLSRSLTINGSSSYNAGTSTIVVAPATNDVFSLYSTQQFYNLTINGATSSSVVYSSPLTSSIRVQNTLNIINIGALYYGSGFTNNRIQVFGNVACSDSDGWTANPSNQNPGSVYMVGTAAQSISGNGSLSRIYIEKTSGTVSLGSFTGRMGLNGPWRQAWLTSSNQGTLDIGGTTCDMELTVWKGTLSGTGTINGFVAIQQNGVISPAGSSVGCITINGGTTGGLNISGTYLMDINGSTPCTQHDKIIVNGALGLSNTTSTIAGGSSTTLASSIIAIELNSGNDINGHFNGLLTNGIATIGSNRFSINYGGGNGNDVELTYTTNMPPFAVCNAQTAFMGSSCSPIAISSNVLGNGSYDQDGSSVTLSATPSGPYALGTTAVQVVATDAQGAVAYCNTTVVVQDTTAPTVPTLTPISIQCGGTHIFTAPTATDNCSMVYGFSANNFLPVDTLTFTSAGTYSLLWYFQDDQGNYDSAYQVINVGDNTAPVPNAASLATVTSQCSATVSTIPTATDNCAGVIQGTTTNPLSYTTAGTYTIVWSFNDGRGNISTQNQTVVVNDNTAPVPLSSSLATINKTCKAYLNQISYPWALDNCKGYIKATTNAPTSFSVGTHTITWVFNDGNGNTSTQTQQVVVTDNTAPTPSVASLPTINRQCNYTVAFPYPTATDNCRPGTFAGTPSQTTFSTQGTHTLVWTYNDNNGNTTTQTQTIVIQDTTQPALSCKGTSSNPFYIGLTSNGTLSFTSSNLSQVVWSATDNCGGSITLTQVSGQSSFTCVNANQNFTIGVRATDAMGNFRDGTAYIRIVAGSGNDNDCDGVHNTCDECDGGNDAIDNNNDGLPDCKYPPAFADVKPSWKVGTSQVWVWYRNSNNHTPTLIQYSQLQNLINTNQVWLGSAAFCSSSKSVAEEQDAPDLQYASAVVVMPNPASQYINIVFPEATQEACTIRISNILGETIVTHTTNTGSTQATINLDSDVFVNGSYTITIDTSHGTLTKQFVVVR